MDRVVRPEKIIANVKFRFEGKERTASRLFSTETPISALVNFIQTQCGHYASTGSLQLAEYTGISAPASTGDIE